MTVEAVHAVYDRSLATVLMLPERYMRSGSSTGCGVKGWADNRDTLMYYCWTYGENGTWTYVWNLDDNTLGWVKDSLLPDGGSWGSGNYCGF